MSRGGSRARLDSIVLESVRAVLRQVRATARLASPPVRERIADLVRDTGDALEGMVDAGPDRWDHALDLHGETIDREREAGR